MAEGLVWKNIPFPDNGGCVQLFNHKPAGLFSVLDEESRWRNLSVVLAFGKTCVLMFPLHL